MKKNNKHIGTTTLEDFLREDGTLEEIDRNVQKRLLAMQLQDKMKECSITKYRLNSIPPVHRLTVFLIRRIRP